MILGGLEFLLLGALLTKATENQPKSVQTSAKAALGVTALAVNIGRMASGNPEALFDVIDTGLYAGKAVLENATISSG